MDKINAFLTWWHSIFGNWNPNILRSLYFWFLDEDMIQRLPMAASWLMLAVVVCSILAIPLSLVQRKGVGILFKIGTIPLCFLGLITAKLASDMSNTLIVSTLPNFISIFTEMIPGLSSQPDIGSFLLELFNVIIAIPLGLFSIVLHGGLTLLGLTPFLIVVVVDVIVYTWSAPIHILADLGGGLILILALALIVLGAGFVGAFMLLGVFLPGFGPIFFQGIREWNFIGSGGTIIKK